MVISTSGQPDLAHAGFRLLIHGYSSWIHVKSPLLRGIDLPAMSMLSTVQAIDAAAICHVRKMFFLMSDCVTNNAHCNYIKYVSSTVKGFAASLSRY